MGNGKSEVQERRAPLPTVDLIIELKDQGIVLIRRKNPPYGWALPGGFVDYGETLEQAAVREAKEETSLEVKLIRQFHAYSDPARDPRGHTISVVFIASASGEPRAADDAGEVGVFREDSLPEVLAFDHGQILADYFSHAHRRGPVKRRIQQLVGLVRGLIQDARIPKRDKVILGGLLALLISPVDLIPDFIPVLGYLDDFFMWVLLLDYLFHRIDPGVLADHYPWDLRGYQRMRRWVGYISWVIPGFLKNRIWAQVKTETEDTLQQRG